MTFHDNGDGTATLSGTPSATGTFSITFAATNTVGTTSQNFTLTTVHASDFSVNTTADTGDINPGDGVCADASGNCSMRAAIQETNALAVAHSIFVPSGNYSISGGELGISANTTINGAGAESTTVDPGGHSRVFNINSGANVTISGLTITNGLAGNTVGGGVYIDGALTLNNSVVSHNFSDASGGGIFIDTPGSLTVASSTFSGNQTGNIGGPHGGAIAHNGTTLPAIDAGNHSTCPTSDQRGVFRPQGSACDVGAYEVQINKPSTSTILTSAPNPSSLGQPVGFNVTVSSSGGTPPGNVTFMEGATVLGTLTLSGGTATFNTSTLSLGAHSITAVYGETGFFLGSTSSSLAQTVNPATTSTAFTASPNPSTLGQNVTFTATITPQYGGSATGTVTFYDAATSIGSGTISSNVATFSTSSLATGSHSITASYGGDSNFSGSTSSPVSQVVNQGPAITSGNNTTLVVGTAGSFTVTTTGSPTPSIAESGALPSGVSFADNHNGTGTLSGTPTASGVFSITFIASNGVGSPAVQSFTLTVGKAATTTGLTSSPNPSAVNQSVLFTATVTGPGTPTGSVTFKAGATLLGTRTLSGGVATLSFAFTTTGTMSVRAIYSGDANFLNSTSPALNQIVNKASTTTVVTSKLNPSSFNQPVTFTTTVSPTPPNGETVTFKDGAATLGTGTLSGGIATFTISSLAVGVHSIRASYAGDTNFAGSTSTTLSQTVNKANTTTTLGSSPNPSNAGQSGGTPTGSVVFKDGTNTLSTVTVSRGVASFSTSSLTHGVHHITASYEGDSNFKTSTATLTQTVH